jgi:serine/threonine protein kinase
MSFEMFHVNNVIIGKLGEYRLSKQLGQGSYGIVHEGVDTKTRTSYAVKVISIGKYSLDAKVLSGFENEIKIMYFSHNNILKLREHFPINGTHYNVIMLVSELCSCDLNTFIVNQSHKRIEEKIAINFLSQITDGLAFLHKEKYIHRDLKPANILLSVSSGNATIKIADFGLARFLGDNSTAFTHAGTARYMVTFFCCCIFRQVNKKFKFFFFFK